MLKAGRCDFSQAELFELLSIPFIPVSFQAVRMTMCGVYVAVHPTSSFIAVLAIHTSTVSMFHYGSRNHIIGSFIISHIGSCR